MEVETTVDVDRADVLVGDLRGVIRGAEPALEDDELEVLEELAAFVEDVACIETGERIMQSPMTGAYYRVTRWVEIDDGQVVALSKEEVDAEEVSDAPDASA